MDNDDHKGVVESICWEIKPTVVLIEVAVFTFQGNRQNQFLDKKVIKMPPFLTSDFYL